MTQISEWVASIQKDVPEPLDSIIARYVRFAVQDFFKASESWRVKDSFSIFEGTNSVYLNEVPSNCYAIAMDWAFFTPANGKRYKLIAELHQNIDPANSENNHKITTLAMDDIGETVLFDSDKDEGFVEMQYIIQPNITIDTVPQLLADKYFETIRDGAIAKILNMPNRSWTNRKGASLYMDSYLQGVHEAKREARRDRSRPRRVVKFNSGFAW
jgi:hypothetical protein